jgi:hypothetical protein
MAKDPAPTFLSYAREDSVFVLRLAKDLKASGATIWLDQLDIKPGERWDRAVENALGDSPKMLVILSPTSVDSNNVMDEVSFALEEQKEVIPVLHTDCKIPLRLRRMQYIDFRSEYEAGLNELLKTLHVDTPAKPLELHNQDTTVAPAGHSEGENEAPGTGAADSTGAGDSAPSPAAPALNEADPDESQPPLSCRRWP